MIARPDVKRILAWPDVKRILAVAWAIAWYLLVHDRRGNALRLALIAALLWMLPHPVPAAPPQPAVALTARISAPARQARHVPSHARSSPVARRPRTVPAHTHMTTPERQLHAVAARASGAPGDTTRASGAPGGVARRVAAAPNLAGFLAAPPSTSAAAIQRALHDAGSPLADTRPRRAGLTYAQYLWDRGKASGIDPAVAMALFWHESHYGTLGMATLTHDLANARPDTTGPQICNGDGCYAYDSDWFAGIDRMYALLRRYHSWGLLTVDQLVPVWAPPGDFNDDGAYIESVHETLQRLDLGTH